MRFGVATFVTDDGIRPDVLGRALEERGFDSLFIAEHSHIPVNRESPWPEGGELPRRYYRTLDPFVALTAVAAVTTRLVLGTGIALLPQRDVIHTAKQVASLDVVSDGRFAFGVGVGWNREEMRNHGTDPRRRVPIMTERIKAMREIWINDEASFHGEHVDFDRIWSWPKPAQRPHPPVLIGGAGPSVLDRVLDHGDGWFPQWHDENVFERITELRARADRYLQVQMLSVPPDAKALEQCERAGVDRVSVWLPSGPWNVVEPALEKWEAAIGELTGR